MFERKHIYDVRVVGKNKKKKNNGLLKYARIQKCCRCIQKRKISESGVQRPVIVI
jgi:hypothetical protein